MEFSNIFKRLGMIAAIATIAACDNPAADNNKVSSDPLVVETKGEAYQGTRDIDGTRVFRGIPFAAPPAGDLRFADASHPIARAGVQDATSFGDACPQGQGNPNWYRDVINGFGGNPDEIPQLTAISEDCLHLNVWAADDASDLPVMIWIHGGSNSNGFAYEPNYLGYNLAKKDVVVVSVNYRMHALGFLPHPDLEDPSGNYGLSDLVMALTWVKENIEAFGGDANNITLFGESAGGGNIAALMRSDKAEGLFQRAIIQSGAMGPGDMAPYARAKDVAAKAFEKIGALNIKEARALPWQDYLHAARRAGEYYYHSPVVDGVWQREDGRVSSGIDLMIGSNANEYLMYLSGDVEKDLKGAISRYAPDVQEKIIAHIEAQDLEPRLKSDYASTAIEFHCPSVFMANEVLKTNGNAYQYLFTRLRENSEKLLAYHGAEIPYVFDTHDSWLPTNDVDAQLTKTMMDYWVNFARTGNPNGDSVPTWEPVANDKPYVQELGDNVGEIADTMAPLCALIKSKN